MSPGNCFSVTGLTPEFGLITQILSCPQLSRIYRHKLKQLTPIVAAIAASFIITKCVYYSYCTYDRQQPLVKSVIFHSFTLVFLLFENPHVMYLLPNSATGDSAADCTLSFRGSGCKSQNLADFQLTHEDTSWKEIQLLFEAPDYK